MLPEMFSDVIRELGHHPKNTLTNDFTLEYFLNVVDEQLFIMLDVFMESIYDGTFKPGFIDKRFSAVMDPSTDAFESILQLSHRN
jgi:hypothetical protein